MNIWWVNHHAVLPSQGGGTRHFDISRELVEKGHSLTVFASSRDHGSGREAREHKGLEPVVEEVEGVRWVWIRTTPYFGNGVPRAINMVSFGFGFLRAAWQLGRENEKPQVVIGSSVHPVAALAGWVLARLWGLTAITEIRDIWPEALIDLGFSRFHPGILFFSVIEKILYRHSDAIFTVLPNSIDYFESHGCPRDHIHWLPNGTSMALQPPKELARPFRAMYLGTLGDGYGLETLIHAAAILEERGAEIEIVLKGKGPRRERLAELIEELGLTTVTLEEAIPKTQVAETLAGCHALIFHLPPSPVFRWGISSNKLFDYLASGRPVIFACEAANNPIEASGAGLTIPPESPNALAEGLLHLSQLSESERLEMGRRGQEFIRENHTIAGIAERFEDAVSETLARTSR